MAYTYDLSKKTYTDVPMLDEIVHNVKLIIQDIVVKDKEEALSKETAESINEGELYVACMEGKASIYSFKWNRAMIDYVNEYIKNHSEELGLDPWSDNECKVYAIDYTEIPEEYNEVCVEQATKYYIDNYVEKNNYYRMLHGEPDYQMPDYYIDAKYVPKKYYKNFIDPNVDNLQYIPNYIDKYYFATYNAYVKAMIHEGRYQLNTVGDYISDSPIKYIQSEPGVYTVNTETRYLLNNNGEYEEDINGDFVYRGGKYIAGPKLYIKNPEFLSKDTPNYLFKLVERYLYRVPINQITAVQLSILRSSGAIARIIEDNPDRRYLQHLGDRKIDYYTARKAEIFEILYIPKVEELVLYRFYDIYEKNRLIYLKRFYSMAYKYMNPYYDKFMSIMIIGQTFVDMVSEMPEWYIRRDVFDIRTCQFLLESHGIKFFKEIPLKFQIGMVRKMNQLIKYKSTTRNIYDLADIFGLDDVVVYKHYIMKTNKTGTSGEYGDLNGGYAREMINYDKKNEADGGKPETEIWKNTGGYDGGRPGMPTNYIMSLDDLEEMYDLFFIKVPIKDSIDNYIHDDAYRLSYNSVTTKDTDPYWDGESDHNTLKYRILQKDFSVQCTKYLSLNSTYKMSEYHFMMVYFMNLIMNNRVSCNMLELSVPIINSSAVFKLKDLFILLFCFATKYYPCQLDQGVQNKVFIDNRDPRTYWVDQEYVLLGDYSLEGDKAVKTEDGELDLDIDGGSAFDYYKEVGPEPVPYGPKTVEYYDLNGGYAYQVGIKPENIDCGRVRNSQVDLDYPETSLTPQLSTIFGDDVNAFGANDYSLYMDFDGGNVAFVRDRHYTKDYVIDGGGPVLHYVYTAQVDINEKAKQFEEMCAKDPCLWFKESKDKFRYPYMDTSNRIDGFNMEANLDYLEKQISEPLHPKFEWLRGYTLRDVLPTKYDPPGSEKHYFEYDKFESFPMPGKVGDLLQDIDTGKYYMWGSRGYYEVDHIYEYGIQDFLTPTRMTYDTLQYDDTTQLLEIYYRNSQIYRDLVEEIDACEDQDEYFILEYVKEYLFTMEWDLSYYTISTFDQYNNYVTQRADTFQEFIDNKNAVLYQFYESIMSEKDDSTRMYNIGEVVDQISDSIDMYLETDALKYIYYFLPSKSWGSLLKWLSTLINFFKSYKTYMMEVSAHIIADDKYEMRAQGGSDHIVFKRYTYYKGDTNSVRDEYEMQISCEMEDSDIVDYRSDDKVFIDYTSQGVIDLNGGTPSTSHFSLDLDGSASLIPVNESYIDDRAMDIDGGNHLEWLREMEYNGGKYIDITDPMGFDLNGGTPTVIQYTYNINGGLLPDPTAPIAVDINGGVPDTLDEMMENYNGAIATDDLEDITLMMLDGGYATTAPIYYTIYDDSSFDNVLDDPDAEELDGGGPEANPSMEGHELIDESKLSEYYIDGDTPFRASKTGVYVSGYDNLNSYSITYDEIDTDLDGGHAPDMDTYYDFDGSDPSADTKLGAPKSTLDGGWPNVALTSTFHQDIARHMIQTYTIDDEGNKYPFYPHNNFQYIDLDGGWSEDKTAGDLVSYAYVDRMIKSFIKKRKASITEDFDKIFSPYGAADRAEMEARAYIDNRLTWHEFSSRRFVADPQLDVDRYISNRMNGVAQQ